MNPPAATTDKGQKRRYTVTLTFHLVQKIGQVTSALAFCRAPSTRDEICPSVVPRRALACLLVSESSDSTSTAPHMPEFPFPLAKPAPLLALGRPALALDCDRIRRLRASGASIREISAQLEVSTATVHKVLRQR